MVIARFGASLTTSRQATASAQD